jgi:hypothetical protein
MRSTIHALLYFGFFSGVISANFHWYCMKFNEIFLPISITNEDEIQCLSTNHTHCVTHTTSINECQLIIQQTVDQQIQPLVCGKMYESIYGESGYDNPNHWCYYGRHLFQLSKGQVMLQNPHKNKCVTVITLSFLQITECNPMNPAQQFVYEWTSHTIQQNGLCMDDGGGTFRGETKFKMSKCLIDSHDQQFTYDLKKFTFENIHKPHLCIDDDSETYSGNQLTYWTCEVYQRPFPNFLNIHQQFTHISSSMNEHLSTISSPLNEASGSLNEASGPLNEASGSLNGESVSFSGKSFSFVNLLLMIRYYIIVIILMTVVTITLIVSLAIYSSIVYPPIAGPRTL